MREPAERPPAERSVLKRAFDVAFAVGGLIVTSPVCLLAAVAIKMHDGGPILFTQERSGLRGRVFEAIKFRSMQQDAERAGARQATIGDPRVTALGRWLRATALDELPQLWNILKGDMSVVGPRALRPGEIEAHGPGVFERLEDVPGFAARARVRPGLTGVAQLYAGRNLPRRQKFRYDRLYIRRYSFGLDLRLIVLSMWVSLSGQWETRGRSRRRQTRFGEPANRA